MKKIFLIQSLLIICMVEIHSANYDTAIVTDVNYLNRTSLPENIFPVCYNPDCEFVSGIFTEIENLSKQKFGVQEVIFMNPEIKSKNGLFRDKLQIDVLAKQGNVNDIYIAIDLVMDNQAEWNNGLKFRLTINISAKDFKGNDIYENKTSIPIEIAEPEDITSELLLSDDDFYFLWQNSINKVFTETNKKTVLMNFVRPSSDYWQTSLKGADKYYLIKKRKQYFFNSDQNGTTVGLKIKRNFWRSMDGGFNLGRAFQRNKIRDSYTISNNFNNKIYREKVIGKTNMLFESFAFTGDIAVELYEGKKIVGKLTLTDYDNLEGTIYEKNYKVQFNPQHNIFEISCNDESFALVKEMKGYMVVYTVVPLESEQIGYMLDMLCIYDHSVFALEQMHQVQTEVDNSTID